MCDIILLAQYPFMQISPHPFIVIVGKVLSITIAKNSPAE